VQFESDGQEDDYDRRNKAKSESTDPLETDSVSDDDAAVLAGADGRVATAHVRVPRAEIQEQFGYNPRRLNRIKMRREHELTEFNYGINFA